MEDNNTKDAILHNHLTSFKFDNGVRLDDRLSGSEIYQLMIYLLSKKEKTNQEKVTEFNTTFNAQVEDTNVVNDFQHKKLRIALIMEELLELSFALNEPREDVYDLFTKLFSKVYTNTHFTNNGENLTETFDAGLDLLVVVYGLFDTFNMAKAVEEGMKEVHNSNMSKLCNGTEELTKTVQKYKEQDIEVISEHTPKGYIVKNKNTGKILKSISFQKPNLTEILIKHKII